MPDTEPCTRFCATHPDCDCGREREKARAEPPLADQFADIEARRREIAKQEEGES